MIKNITSLLVFMLIIDVFLIVMTVFGVSSRKFACRNKQIQGSFTTRDLIEAVKSTGDLTKGVRTLMYDTSEEAQARYRNCLNRTIFYLNGIGFFIGGLGLGFSLDRKEWVKYVLLPPLLFFLLSNVPAFKSYLLKVSNVFALPFFVSESLLSILAFAGLSFLGGYLAQA